MNIPQRWLDVLSALKAAGFTEAFIGGGALRDLDNGRPVKDIDVFIRHRGDLTFEMVGQAFGYDGWNRTEFHADYQTFFNEVQGVYEFSVNPPSDDPFDFSSPDTPFNIIACTGPEGDFEFQLHHLERFDLGICRIAHNGVVCSVHSSYGIDKQNCTLTIVNTVRLSRSIERAQRIRDRAYDGWVIVYPVPDDHAFDVVT